MRKRFIICDSCNSRTRGVFPTGYRAVGIDTCPECGSRDITIRLTGK